MGWTLSFERVCLVCQRIWRENHHWFVTSKQCCCCYWSIYNAFFFSFFFFRISTYLQVTKDLRLGPFDGFCLPIMWEVQACLVRWNFSKTLVQIENSGLITKMNKKQIMKFHLTFHLEKKPCCYIMNVGRVGRPLSTQISRLESRIGILIIMTPLPLEKSIMHYSAPFARVMQ